MKNQVLLLTAMAAFTAVILNSCNPQSKEENTENGTENTAKTETILDNDSKALALMQQNCFSCHNPEMGGERAAPPMFMVRNHYFDDETSREEFIEDIVDFVKDPTEEKSIMPGAVRNFGLMPKQHFKEEDLKLIAAYMYDNDLESDAWYAKWETFKKQPKVSDAGLSDEDKGLQIANAAKAELGKNLLGAIQKFGAPGAVDFCNVRAIPLTDSMARVHNATIKRVSDKPRNPNNQANKTEIAYIKTLQENLAKGEKTPPQMAVLDHNTVGYYTIETNKMCLQCHGIKGKDIKPETWAKINEKYPKDKATGYAENQVRGIWVVTMDKN